MKYLKYIKLELKYLKYKFQILEIFEIQTIWFRHIIQLSYVIFEIYNLKYNEY